MSLFKMSDSQIRKVAEPILKDTIIGANNKDWKQFSKHMPARESSNTEIREDVERQWEEDKYLTAFSTEFEFMGIIRKMNCILVLWKLTSSESEDEYLEKLYLEETDGHIQQAGIWTE